MSKSIERSAIRVAVVGGLTRARNQWAKAGKLCGVELEHHAGRPGGRASDEIVAMVRRADVVVIITNPNSHNSVIAARRAAVDLQRPHVLVDHLRPGGLATVLSDARTLALVA